MSKAINWKELEKKQGEVVSTGSGANVIELSKGEHFIGKFLGTEEIKIGDKEPFTSLQFETEKGKQAISGSSLVQQMRMINKNSIVRVTFTGTKKTNSGNKVKQFTVEALSPNAINEKEREKIKKEIALAVAKKSKKSKKGSK